MTFPAYFIRIVGIQNHEPVLRVYRKADADARLLPIHDDIPMDRPALTRLLQDLAGFL